MSARIFKSTVQKRTISKTGGVATADTKFTLDSTDTLPTDYPYTMVIDPDLTTEEIVTVTGSTGSANEFNITRGQDGTTAQDHSNGSYVKHMITGRDMGEPQKHIEATGAYSILNNGENSGVTTGNIVKTLHGIGTGEGVVVGTDKTQTLTAKTLTAPNINSPVVSGGTLSSSTIDGATLTNTTTNSGTISGGGYIGSSISFSSSGNLNLGVAKTASLTSNGVNISSAEVAALKDLGVWQTWTSPTINSAGWTGSWSNNKYVQIGKTVHFRGTFTLSATPTGTALNVSLPVTAAVATKGVFGAGTGTVSGAGNPVFAIDQTSTTSIDVRYLKDFGAAATGIVHAAITASLPGTWANGNSITIYGTYEAA